ncbi:MAG TPA: cysteine--tRNA ligase [Candidatus Sulfotelmatobacter sp.]|jgi:L-cysteine:1D-myo-inositol 2-amino-2-deoxy-alpha-D-glucopyranoside ligase|nr:cysteine--tRNA ligase [Candidatus Sulfotelmatobacter sp.]
MKLFNSLTKTKETFASLQPNKVTMYVCGITPYDTTHLGHAFTYTIFDVLYRFLKFQNYQVNYTQNVTDIDDDILKKAKQIGKDWQKLGTFWTDKYRDDMRILNNIAPTHYAKASETMPTIIDIIKKLMIDGFAYEKNGNVYFLVQKNPDYGKLSKYNREKMIQLSKERGANPDDQNKKDPLDFILWQKSKPKEPFWESPWGKGRPGWHIECSAMVYKYLGKKIDIHGGGTDLIYPHHESEIAQSEQFTREKPFCQFWMHVGMVGYQGEKMSKSLGNLVMVSDLLKTYSPNAIRYLLLSHHYRDPWEYYQEELDKAAETIQMIEEEIRKIPNNQKAESLESFSDALSDDLNIPKALKVLSKTSQEENANVTKRMLKILGFIV